LFLGSIVALGLVACGGDDGSSGDDDIDPAGTNNTFVISKISLPTNATEATMLGLDIDDKANDGVDNQLGTLLASIRTLAPGLNIQMSLDDQVDTGGIVLLANVKATALDNASGVGLWVYQGDMPMPAPCTDPNDTVCRHHLDGTGTFGIKAGSQTDAKLAGSIMAGTFKGGPGRITLQLALSAGAPIDLPLQKAKAEITVSANGFGTGSKLGGAISQGDIDTVVNPAIHTTVTGIIDRDFTGARTPPCGGCLSGWCGGWVLGFLDGNNDCRVTVAVVMTTVDGILTDDIDLDGDTVNDAVSLGVGVSAVKGGFTAVTN
jgi:hypothetical protein